MNDLQLLAHELRLFLEFQTAVGAAGIPRAPAREREAWRARVKAQEKRHLEQLKSALRDDPPAPAAPPPRGQKPTPRPASKPRPEAPAANAPPQGGSRADLLEEKKKPTPAPQVSSGNALWKQFGSRPVHLFKERDAASADDAPRSDESKQPDQVAAPAPPPEAPEEKARPRSGGFTEVRRTGASPEPAFDAETKSPSLFGEEWDRDNDPARSSQPLRGFDDSANRQKKLSSMSKAQKLDFLRECLGDCTRCKLSQTRKNIVFGDGSPEADLVFVGEGPGYNEDQQGLPFVGKAGKLLDRMIVAMGTQREDVYICNVVKCRPPNNRDPEPDEIRQCSPFLYKQLEAIDPKAIVTLGRFASQSLLNTTKPMRALRGRWHDWRGVPVMPIYHPAYLLRNKSAKRSTWENLQKVMKMLGLEPPAR